MIAEQEVHKNILKVLYRFKNRIRVRHNTELKKSIEMLEWLIKTYTNEGDVVLDNTFGFGTEVLQLNTIENFIGN